jgi:hypothetical protein
MNIIKSWADFPQEIPNGNLYKYKAIFEFRNGMIGTWEDYAPSADDFVRKFLMMKDHKYIKRIKRFSEVYQKHEEAKPYFEEHFSVRIYNQVLEAIAWLNT